MMKHEKKYKEQEEFEQCLNEPSVAYSAKNESVMDVNDIPVDILVDLVNRALLEVENGGGYTTEEVMNFIDKEMAWR